MNARWVWRHFKFQWDLMIRGRSVATVFPPTTARGVYWHTWDQHGTGGENDIAATVKDAMSEARAAAKRQGFIPKKKPSTEGEL